MFKALGMTLFNNGYEVIPIDGKRPVINGWQDIELTEEVVHEWAENGKGGLNIGVRCGDVYAADFDFYDKDISDKVSKSFVAEFGPAPIRVGQAPKKLLVYKGIEGQTKLKRSWRDADDVVHGFELLGKGQQFAAFGVHPDTGKDYEWLNESLEDNATHELKTLNFEKVKAWMAKIEVPSDWVEIGGGSVDDLGDFEGLIDAGDYDKLTEDEVIEYLEFIDNNMENDDWVKVGMSLYSWDEDEGLAIWEAWSKGGASYKKGETRKRWRSFEDGVRVTVGTLIYMAKLGGWKPPSFRERLSKCTNEDEMKVVATDIKDSKVDNLERQTLAGLMKNMIRDFTGVSVPIADVRRLVTTPTITEARPRPEWCNNWVYVLSHQQYVHLNNLSCYSGAAFNLRCGVRIPVSESGNKPSAVSYVADGGFISIVDKMEYNPTNADKIIGKTLNTYREKDVPVATERSEVNEKLIWSHMVGLIGEDDALVFLQWMAWQVQRTGELVRWSPIIVGDEGIGKSFFGVMISSALGERNVGVVSPNTIKSQFNSWAEGVVVNVLQELKLTGHNRFDVANAVKPLITDPIIEIHGKGLKPYSVRNVTNYMVFSNFKDAVPLNTKDRRWWVSFAREYEGSPEYFNELFAAAKDAGAVRAWLESVNLPDNFNSRAPLTEAKKGVIETEKSMTEGLQEAEDLLAKGSEWWTEKVFSSHEFREQLELEVGPLTTRSVNFLFKKLGFYQKGLVKINGDVKRIWLKNHMDNKDIRAEIGNNSEI